MDDNTNINIKFDDNLEVHATREVLEDLLDKQFVKDNLSICDYKRIKDLAKQLWHNTTINNDGKFLYRGYEFILIRIFSPIIMDKVICFMTGTDSDVLMPWCSEKVDIIEAYKMPPDSLLVVIDNYLDK